MDDRALAALRAELVRAATRWTGSPEDAEDVVQDAFVAYLAAGYPQPFARPLLFRIARNRWRDLQRHRGRYPAASLPDRWLGIEARHAVAPHLPPALVEAETPDLTVARWEEQALVWAVLAQLRSQQRAALIRWYWLELPGPKYVRHRARGAFRRRWDARWEDAA